MGRGEDRARDWRRLATAGVALEQPAGSQLAIRPPAAGGAFEAIRPARRNHYRAAFLLRTVERIKRCLAETLLELHLVPSHYGRLATTRCSWFVPCSGGSGKSVNRKRFGVIRVYRTASAKGSSPTSSKMARS